MTSLWRHRDFRLLWTGDTISQFGTAISQIAIPLLAATVLAATPFEMGLLTATGSAAFLLIGLPAGVWVDRVHKRPLMIKTDLARGLLFATIPVAWWLGVLTLVQVLVVALLTGVCTVFFDVAYQAYLPALVTRDKLVEGNAKLQASMSVATVSGPALAGGLVQLLGAATTVFADALSYAGSALSLSRIRTVEPPLDRHAERNLRKEVGEGLRFVLGNPLLRAIVGCTGTANFFNNVTMTVAVLFLVRDIHLSAGVVGLLFTSMGVGGVIGAVTSTWWQRKFGQARTIWLSIVTTQPFVLLLPLTEPGWRVVFFAVPALVFDYGVIVYNVAQVSFRQAICPDRLLGRMNASIRFLVWGTIPLGGLLGGVLGEWIGLRNTIWVGAIGVISAGLWVVLSPLRGMRDIPAEAASGAQPTTVG